MTLTKNSRYTRILLCHAMGGRTKSSSKGQTRDFSFSVGIETRITCLERTEYNIGHRLRFRRILLNAYRSAAVCDHNIIGPPGRSWESWAGGESIFKIFCPFKTARNEIVILQKKNTKVITCCEYCVFVHEQYFNYF